jgi:hypothetical protein
MSTMVIRSLERQLDQATNQDANVIKRIQHEQHLHQRMMQIFIPDWV